MTALHDRILEISQKHNLSHLGSCLTAVNIISDIYFEKKENEPFILSCGHAGVALYCVLEQHYGFDAEKLYLKHGTHPNRSIDDKIYCSTGSLGMGISIALGMAMADRDKHVYCLISDGEAHEGVCYEVSNVIKKYKLDNLKIHVNFNNWSAYDYIPNSFKETILHLFPDAKIHHTVVEDYNLLGQSAHYITADKL